MKTFFDVKNISQTEGQICIYGDITKYAWEEYGETSSIVFSRQVAQLKDVQNIALKINSPGGDIFEALAIYNEIKRLSKSKNITAYIDGVAGSAASLLVLAANKAVIGKGCYYMIHNPLLRMGYSNVQDMQEAIEFLNKTKENLLDIYISKTNLSREEIANKMDSTTWFNADEALAAGFVDEIASYEFEAVNSSMIESCKDLKIPQIVIDAINKTKEKKEKKMTLAELKNKCPEVIQELRNEIINEIQQNGEITKVIENRILEERNRIKNLDSIVVFNEEQKKVVDKAKFEEPRDHKDIIVEFYNSNAAKAKAEIGQVETEKKEAGIYNIVSNTVIGSSQEQLENSVVNAALEELKKGGMSNVK
ncbi:head maturation protease, ClpP-related [Fusobacterium ulcerans]